MFTEYKFDLSGWSRRGMSEKSRRGQRLILVRLLNNKERTRKSSPYQHRDFRISSQTRNRPHLDSLRSFFIFSSKLFNYISFL